MTRGARALLAVSALAVAMVAAHALGVGGARLDGIALNGAYNVAIATGALLCLLRARATPRERGAWLCMGLGLAAWGAAEVYWSLAYGSNGDPASPNPSDAGYLLYYPLAYAGLGLLVRDRVRELRLSMWLDGVVEGLVVSALAAALLAGPVFEDGAAGDPSTVAVTLAYPVLDLLLIGFVVAAFALAGWRPGRSWGLLGAGLAIGALADVLYLYQVAGQAGLGGLVDVLWPASVALIGLAAWQPPRRVVAAPAEGWRLVGIPVAAATAAALLVLGGAGSLNPVALALAAGGLAAALARMTLSIAENARMLKTSRREALTDGLTGLGNRRKLMVDLRHEIETAHQVDEYRVLALFDLDGFKLYNDSFGHPAGDALLARLGGRLAGAMGTTSEAYRMGGDEFCALVRVPKDGDETLVVREAALALSERGEGFTVDSSFGTVALPDEAYDPVEALQLADRRMYRHKDRRRSSARRQAHDVLLRCSTSASPICARTCVTSPTWPSPSRSAWATTTWRSTRSAVRRSCTTSARWRSPTRSSTGAGRWGRRSGSSSASTPSSVSGSSPPRHRSTASPGWCARATSAGTARATRTAWGARRSPLGARIIAVCDAYDAMISPRPYRDRLTAPEAIEELRRGAGTQFDPAMVGVLCDELAARRQAGVRSMSIRPPVAEAPDPRLAEAAGGRARGRRAAPWPTARTGR